MDAMIKKPLDASTKEIRIVISEDNMSATALLVNPGDEQYSVPEVVCALKEKKVIMGLDTRAIMEMVSGKIYDSEVVVARGKEKVPSVDGYYEYFFDTEKHVTPIIREDGTADYSAVGRLENVEEGQIVAKYHPAVTGQNGYNVRGNELVVKMGKELPVLRGQKIERNDETNEYKALIAGKISLNNGNIEILDYHEINEDVTMIQGKIEFFGDLVINGNVESGVVIRAGRNVVVSGTVGAASIYAGGDVILQKGIQGGDRGKVSARGNVFSDFVEYATIEAGMDVYANSIINSTINTKGYVIVSGTRGSVIGGRAHGLKGIEVNGAGNKSEIKTVLHTGVEQEEYQKLTAVSEKEKKAVDKLDLIMQAMSAIINAGRKAGKITAMQKQQLLSLGKEKDTISTEINQCKEEKADLSRRLAACKNAGIIVHGDIYRNVYICIDSEILAILSKESYVRFVKTGSEIERRSIL